MSYAFGLENLDEMAVYWVLCGNREVPSARIHGIRVHEYLRKVGVRSTIIHKPNRYFVDLVYPWWAMALLCFFFTKKDVVVFQKVFGQKAVAFVRRLGKRGVKVIFIDCDLPLKKDVASLADIVVCPSSSLVDQYVRSGVKNVRKIDDAVECFLPPAGRFREKRRIVWFGKSGSGKWRAVEWFRSEILPALHQGWEFVTVSDHPESDYRWDVESCNVIVSKADVAVIPVFDSEQESVKSSNRCTQSLALSVPVICSPLESYMEVVTDGVNGFIASQRSEWLAAIRRFEDDAFLNDAKASAFESAQRFSIEVIGKGWLSVLQPEAGRHTRPNFIIKTLSLIFCEYWNFRIRLSSWKKKSLLDGFLQVARR